MRYRLMMLGLRLKLAPAWLARQPGARPIGVLGVFAAAALAALLILAVFNPLGTTRSPGRPCVVHATSARQVTCAPPSPGGAAP